MKKVKALPRAHMEYLAAWDGKPMLSRIWVTRKTDKTIFTLGKFQHLIGQSQTAEVELIPSNLDGIKITPMIKDAVSFLAAQANNESTRLRNAAVRMLDQSLDLSSLAMGILRNPSKADAQLTWYLEKRNQSDGKNGQS